VIIALIGILIGWMANHIYYRLSLNRSAIAEKKTLLALKKIWDNQEEMLMNYSDSKDVNNIKVNFWLAYHSFYHLKYGDIKGNFNSTEREFARNNHNRAFEMIKERAKKSNKDSIAHKAFNELKKINHLSGDQ